MKAPLGTLKNPNQGSLGGSCDCQGRLCIAWLPKVQKLPMESLDNQMKFKTHGERLTGTMKMFSTRPSFCFRNIVDAHQKSS